jgi:hypothetical protein
MNARIHRAVLGAGLCMGVGAAAGAGCFSSSGDDTGSPAEMGMGAGDAAPADATVGPEGGGAGGNDGAAGDAGNGATDASPDGGCGGGGPGTFSCTGSLAAARIAPGGALLANGKVLIAGGWNAASGTLSTAEIYDPATETFTATGGMARGHLWAGWTMPWPVLPGGQVLVAGGLDATGALLTYAELYDPTTGMFGSTGPLGTAVISFDPVTLPGGGGVLFIGGYSAVTGALPTPGWMYTAGTAQAQRYDLDAAAFADAGTLAEQRLFGCNVLLPTGKVLAIGGWTGEAPTAEANVEQYDPATGQWTTVGTLGLGATCGSAAFVLPSGKVLVDGAFLFDPDELTTVATTNSLPLTSPTFVQFANGNVLAFGGTVNGTASPTALVYAAATGLWTAVGDLHQARTASRGFVLPSGEVLVVGGSDTGGPALASAELYHP